MEAMKRNKNDYISFKGLPLVGNDYEFEGRTYRVELVKKISGRMRAVCLRDDNAQCFFRINEGD